MRQYAVYRVPILAIVVAPKDQARSVRKTIEGACQLLLDCDSPDMHHVMMAYISGPVTTKSKDKLLRDFEALE